MALDCLDCSNKNASRDVKESAECINLLIRLAQSTVAESRSPHPRAPPPHSRAALRRNSAILRVAQRLPLKKSMSTFKRRWRRWLPVVVVLVLPVSATAHTDVPVGGQPAIVGRVSVQGFRIELLTDPAPLRAHHVGRVMARVWRDGSATGDPRVANAAHDPHAMHTMPGHDVAPLEAATSPAMPLIGADVRIALAAADAVRVVERGSAGTYPLALTPDAAGPLRVR